jgi:phytoene dehydrogenase-like protein
MQSSQPIDAVVIGGGVAGLAVATYLARQGKSVRLLEQAHALGGRARTKEQNGFYLNIGPHALYRGGRGIEILSELGVEVHGRVPSVSGGYAIKNNRKHTLPAGFVSLLTTSLFGLSEKLEVAGLLASLGKIDGQAVMGESLSEWVERRIQHASVREFLLATFRVATYTNAPDQMSAGAAIEQLQKAFAKSVLYLDGGWQTIVDGLESAATQAGVAIETGVKVETVERDITGAVRSVRLADGRTLNTATVVIASSPAMAVQLIERGRETQLARWADEAIAVKAACLDVALNRLPNPKATFALGMDRPLYFSVHSATARLAPEGGALIQVAKYLPPDHSDSPEATERELEGLLDLMQPGWRDALAYRRFLPEMITINALPTARRDGTRGRPRPQVADVPGLFIVGDWVGPEGMLVDSSLASAKQAAGLIAAQRTFSMTAVV